MQNHISAPGIRRGDALFRFSARSAMEEHAAALWIPRTVLSTEARPTTKRDSKIWPNAGRNIAGNDNLLRES